MDPNGDEIYNTYHWIKNEISLTNLLLSFNTDNDTITKDYSGYNNYGTISGSTWTQNGIIGGAYNFAGLDSPDHIIIQDDSTLHGDGTWNFITIEHWIYLETNQIDTKTISKMLTQYESNPC